MTRPWSSGQLMSRRQICEESRAGLLARRRTRWHHPDLHPVQICCQLCLLVGLRIFAAISHTWESSCLAQGLRRGFAIGLRLLPFCRLPSLLNRNCYAGFSLPRHLFWAERNEDQILVAYSLDVLIRMSSCSSPQVRFVLRDSTSPRLSYFLRAYALEDSCSCQTSAFHSRLWLESGSRTGQD